MINGIAKLYDMVLCCRIEQWFKPYREQAGAQRGRGCLEHLVTLRLLTDYAKQKKKKLFITFIDFSQAYDMVPRATLLRVLRRLGCGAVMLGAIAAMYAVTESALGSVLITVTLGVRQGSPTSCLLFILFVNDLIKLIKEGVELDGFLSWLHVLVLMDDTVLLATSREKMVHKIRILVDYCNAYGMKINQSKTKFMAINGSREEEEPMRVGDLVVDKCQKYIYLGSPFTADGSTASSVKAHAKAKIPHVLKYVSFLRKNNDIPFIVKRRVLDAALMSTLLYGCESWLGADLKPMSKLYNWCLKELLGVRRSTCNEVCYAELGYPSLPQIVALKQHKFFRNIQLERSYMRDDPLNFAINLVSNDNTATGRLIRRYTTTNARDPQIDRQEIISSLVNSDSSRRKTYVEINPSFVIPSVYKTHYKINESHRISFSRFRVSGHNLACETGRWNRRGRGRLPLDERVCVCGCVQTEFHVVEHCPNTQHLRQTYGFNTMPELLCGNLPPDIMCKIVHEILETYN